jgi:spore coat protein CotH
MKALVLYFAIILLITNSSCYEEEMVTIGEYQDFIVPLIVPNGSEQYLNVDSDYIFDQQKLHTFELKLPSGSLTEIDSDPTAEKYVEGMLIFEGDTISPVGIRYKGSVGAFVDCLSGTDWANPAGYKTCTKLSMKVKINWGGRTEKFYKLKKLQFHSQNLDKSQMHERLGYWLFRKMGVPAPRSVHARLIINETFAGVFALTEQIDSQFVKYNFDDNDGNLYKEVWPLNSYGSQRSDQTYKNALRTNENDNPQVDIIKNFAQNISRANSSDVPNIIEESMNINEIISYVVVDRTIRNDDGAFHWYCGSGGCSNHNYYWYEEPGSQKLHLIPWDLDNAFENLISEANPVTPIANEWGDTSNSCEPFRYGDWGIWQKSASCDKLTAGWASYIQEYEQLKAQFINGPFSENEVDALIDSWTEQIRNATKEAEATHSDALSERRWELVIQDFKNKLEFARNN